MAEKEPGKKLSRVVYRCINKACQRYHEEIVAPSPEETKLAIGRPFFCDVCFKDMQYVRKAEVVIKCPVRDCGEEMSRKVVQMFGTAIGVFVCPKHGRMDCYPVVKQTKVEGLERVRKAASGL